MKFLDRFLQRWRIRKVRPFIPPGARVLDIGCADGALVRRVPGIKEYVGIDPDIERTSRTDNVLLVKGFFAKDLPDSAPFDVITALAVVEHVPPQEQAEWALHCARCLKPGGRLLMTVPSPAVDRILTVLRFFRAVDGMALEEHHGFDVSRTPSLFSVGGLALAEHRTFQLGLNHLFVFVKA